MSRNDLRPSSRRALRLSVVATVSALSLAACADKPAADPSSTMHANPPGDAPHTEHKNPPGQPDHTGAHSNPPPPAASSAMPSSNPPPAMK